MGLELGLLPVPVFDVPCSPGNSQRAVLAVAAHTGTPAAFSSQLLRPGRYVVCYCQATV